MTDASAKPAIGIAGAAKIFGRRAGEALALLEEGQPRSEVMRRTGATPALFDISLDCAGGETTVILGLSGCGKSTLLRLVNRLIAPTQGHVAIGEQDLAALGAPDLRDLRRRRISMVFQQFGLMPHRTVRDNIAFGLELQGMKKPQRRNQADRWIAAVGLDGFADALPEALSGGMRQRVGLARALATEADILLMDEPFSALDPLTRAEMQDLLLRLQKDMKKTILFVTHDVTEAFRLGDALAILRDGSLLQKGTPLSVLKQPKDAYVRAFLSDLDILRGVRAGQVMVPATGLGTADIGADAPLGAALARLTADKPQLLVGPPGTPALGTLGLTDIQAVVTPGDAL